MVVAFLLFAPTPARAEALILALSSETIPITSNFTGTQLALFGSVERDAATIARSGSYDVVVTVRGPRGTVTVREKKRIGPFWINLDQRRYIAIPAFLAVLSNRPLERIGTPEMRAKLRLGVDPLVTPQGQRGVAYDIDEPQFRQALMRLRGQQGLFEQIGDGVRFLSPDLFRATIDVPGVAPLGPYDVDVSLLSDGVPLASASTAFTVVKGGFEERVAQAARQDGLWYGVVTAAFALALGWIASVIFRRD